MNPEFKVKAREVVELFLDWLNKQHARNPMYHAAYPLIRLGKKFLFQWLDENPEEIYVFLKKAKDKIDEGIKLYENNSKP